MIQNVAFIYVVNRLIIFCLLGDKLQEAMTSVANYLIDPNNKVEDKDVKVPVYEHSGLHMVLRKIIAHDKILVKNNESMFNFTIKIIFLLIFDCIFFSSYIF